jgi:hypothetical protein
MNYKDLDIARSARAAKDRAAAEKGKGKRGLTYSGDGKMKD